MIGRIGPLGLAVLAFSCGGSSRDRKSASGPDAGDAGPSADALADAHALADADTPDGSSSCPELTFDVVTVPLGDEVWSVVRQTRRATATARWTAS